MDEKTLASLDKKFFQKLCKLKKGQTIYFTSVMLIFIGFAFFGIFLMQHNFLTGNVISDVDLPTDCSDVTIQGIWSDIFWESSSGISIIKNNSLTGGKCSEYFAYKFDSGDGNLSYFLHGYTIKESGNNVSYIFAERINSSQFRNVLFNITSIENISIIPNRDGSFITSYVFSRGESLSLQNSEEIFNKTFEMNFSQSWATDTSLGVNGFSFSQGFVDDNSNAVSKGLILTDYDYALLSYIYTPIICVEEINCGSWSTCISGQQNRTCINSTCSGNFTYFQNQSCSSSTCVVNWSVGSWSTCFNSLQTRTVVDLNSCANLTGKPATNQTCIDNCVPDWNCGLWEPVICPSTGIQKRNCTDENSCGELFKIETQSCGVTTTSKPTSTSGESSSSGFSFLFIFITIFVVLIIIGLIIWLVFLMKKKNDSGNKNGANESSLRPPFNPPAPLQFSMMKKISTPMKKIIPQNFPRPFSKPLNAPINTTKNFSSTENKKQIVQPAKEKPVVNNLQKAIPKSSQKSVWSSLKDISRTDNNLKK
jgi:hypothetical protein